MADQGHWYTDENGNHYFVRNGETPKEGWERSKRRKMIDGGKYKVDDGDGKGSREVSMEEYNKYEADDDFDETTDDDFGFDEEEEYGDPRLQANADVVSEMMERGINVHDEGAVLDFLDGENYEEEDKREIVQYIRSMVPEDEEDESLENTDNRGEGANPDFNREKFGKYFNPDGTLKKEMEDEYFAATRGESLENTDNRGEGANQYFDDEDEEEDDYGRTGLDQVELASQFELSDEEAEDFADFLYNKGLRDGDEDKAIDFYEEWVKKSNETTDPNNAGSDDAKDQLSDMVKNATKTAADANQKSGDQQPAENNATNNRKELLNQMEGIRNEEREKERSLLEEFGNGSISYDEFKNRESQLHQEAQDRVDSLYEKLNGKGGKKNPNGSEQNAPDSNNPQPAKKQTKPNKTDEQKKAAMKAKAKAKRDKEIQSMGKEIVEYYNGDPIDEDEGQIDEQKINHIEEYFNIWGKPSERELPDVIKHYGLNEKEASELKKRLGRK